MVSRFHLKRRIEYIGRRAITRRRRLLLLLKTSLQLLHLMTGRFCHHLIIIQFNSISIFKLLLNLTITASIIFLFSSVQKWVAFIYFLFFFIVKTKYSTVRIYPTFCCCGGGVVYNFSFLDWLAESKEMERVDERDVTSVHLPLFTRLRRAVFFLHTMHTHTHTVCESVLRLFFWFVERHPSCLAAAALMSGWDSIFIKAIRLLFDTWREAGREGFERKNELWMGSSFLLLLFDWSLARSSRSRQ